MEKYTSPSTLRAAFHFGFSRKVEILFPPAPFSQSLVFQWIWMVTHPLQQVGAKFRLHLLVVQGNQGLHAGIFGFRAHFAHPPRAFQSFIAFLVDRQLETFKWVRVWPGGWWAVLFVSHGRAICKKKKMSTIRRNKSVCDSEPEAGSWQLRRWSGRGRGAVVVVGRASGRRPRAHDVRPNPQNLTVQAVRQSMAAFASFMSATAPPPSGGPAADWGTQGDPVTSWPVGGGYWQRWPCDEATWRGTCDPWRIGWPRNDLRGNKVRHAVVHMWWSVISGNLATFHQSWMSLVRLSSLATDGNSGKAFSNWKLTLSFAFYLNCPIFTLLWQSTGVGLRSNVSYVEVLLISPRQLSYRNVVTLVADYGP